ncbi:MAG TPA: TonB-dependent receptor [Rhizomicrobium sp.]|nr:TonB-dependent receptor [Rhizomicrobium sp.]
MRTSTKCLFITTALVAASVAFSPAAVAQEKSAAAFEGIETVVVTAQKREQSVQDVPISMSVISGEQISQFHAVNLYALQNSIPNLYIERLNAADVIYIRGFGSAPSNFAFDQSVSLYQDGIYGGRGKQFQAPFFDVERVEVARGPQGALFGKNTPAGAISIVTAGPTASFEGRATAAYNFQLSGIDLDGYVSGPITEKLGARIAVKLLDNDGFIKNQTTGNNDPRVKQRLIRVTTKYEPTADIDLTAKFEHSEVRNDGVALVLASPTVRGQVTEDRFADANPFGYREAENVSTTNASVTGNYQVGDHTITSVSGFSTYGAQRANSYSRDVPAIYLNRILERFKQLSQEVRLLSPVGQTFEYIVGGYADWSDYNLVYPKYYNLATVAGSMHSDFHQRAQSYSVFGQGTYNITDDLRLIGSLRYTLTEKTGRFATYLDQGQILGAMTSAKGAISEGNIDPSATAQYDVMPGTMVYATYGKGSKSGGFVSNTVGTVDSTFKFRPEKSRNFEVGVKSQLADDKLIVNVSLYDTKVTDLQTSVYDATISPPGFVTKNAAAATSRGVEGQVTWLPVTSLKLSWSGAYQDAKYDDFPGANCLARQAPSDCTPGLPASAPNSVANNNLAGVPLTFSAKWSGNLRADHTLLLDNNLVLYSTVAAAYRSSFYNSDDQSLIYGVQPGYVKYDMRIQLGDAEDKWHVALVGKNLTNKHTYSFAFFWPSSLSNFPTVHKLLDETRTFAVEASLKF